MTRYLALLRGVNLGQRTIKSAELQQAFAEMGFENVKTLLASGNVLFDAPPAKVSQASIEAALEARFGFAVGTVLRTQQALRALVDSDPFGGRREDGDTKLHVTFLAEPVAHTLPLPCAVEGDFEVVHVTDSEIFIIAHRMPNGRFGAGMDQVWKHFGQRQLWTSRNYNTVLKAAA